MNDFSEFLDDFTSYLQLVVHLIIFLIPIPPKMPMPHYASAKKRMKMKGK